MKLRASWLEFFLTNQKENKVTLAFFYETIYSQNSLYNLYMKSRLWFVATISDYPWGNLRRAEYTYTLQFR